MAGTDTVTVDGVKPSIPVKLLDVKDNPEQVKIFSDDEGTYRYLVKGSDAVLLTPQDLAALSGVEIEIGNSVTSAAEPATVVAPAAEPAQRPISPVNPPVPSGQ